MNKDDFTNQELVLDVGDGHKLYVVDWGNKNARTPIIYLHGGPGGSVKNHSKNVFNPSTQRVIFFDQRGCGKSTPCGVRVNNTTEDLSSDITKIAKKLKIDKFYLHGYSWGSTLALYYAITQPEKLAGIVIGGVFSGSQKEILDMHENAKIFYPDVWDKVLSDTPAEYRSDPAAYHLGKALNGTKSEQKKSTYVMDYMESSLCNFDDRIAPDNFDEYDPLGMQIELHYLANNCFMPDNFILDNAAKIKVPVYIVQGRFDMVCPPNFAHKISKVIPHAKLYWTTSNHKPEHEITAVFRAIFDALVS
ncbi:MAG: alpha/beta fold hydrolase [Candidatus Nomurabacteria bacterium]|jgi:proline iminopeptidase|nr:alpha/beta fold hydrolase [Candidatus Nomurabacteria bacterium]